MKIVALPSFRRCLKAYDDATLERVLEAMNLAAATSGRPYLHSGRGIREIRPGLYECRTGIALRLLFTREKDTLYFDFAGTHEQVKARWKRH